MPKTVQAHSSRDFETELRELRAHLLAMGARCERIVGLAFAGFRDGTAAVMPEVAAIDVQIDGDELAIHALILRILALRQPVANDLRFLATALRLITDLERIGDEAVNIAERADAHGAARAIVSAELGLLAANVLDMLRLALDAFVRSDDEQADRVMGMDDDVDERCAAIIGRMIPWITQHCEEARAGLRVIRVAKYLERIADHATNIAEEAIFIVRGDDVRHGRWRVLAKPNGVEDRARPTSLPRTVLPS